MRKISLVLFCLLQASAGLALETLKCPLKRDNLKLAGISIFDGDPKLKVDLAPTNADQPPPQHWSLSKDMQPWMACRYGKDQKIMFEQRLRSRVTGCESQANKAQIFHKILCN